MSRAALLEHLAGRSTTVCRCWRVRRRDGVVLGFTDHDRPLRFDDTEFRAETGLTARALVQGTGLAVDNTEALGVLSDAGIGESDIEAGRFDGAEVEAWLVNWADPEQRMLRFRGHLGEIRRGSGAFHAELRGLSDLLNQPQGRAYHPACTAILGDGACRFDTATAGYSEVRAAEEVEAGRVFRFADPGSVESGWFERGLVEVLSGPAAGLRGVIKLDRQVPGGARQIELWEPIGARIGPGDSLRLVAGCDKRLATCRNRFDNVLNFRGFPSIPGEDWLVGVPVVAGREAG